MAFLIDTSVLVRLADLDDPLNPLATTAILELHRRGESLHITAQNLVEFRNVATRALTANGLGLTLAETEVKAATFEAQFALLAATPDIFPAWKSLVSGAAVAGKRVHDARLVAVCHAHRISHLLTFNSAHFAALSNVSPGVVVVEPRNV